MRRLLLLVASSLLAGCQATGAGTSRTRSASDDGALARLAAVLPGDYDNHEQVAAAQAKGGAEIVPMRVQHTLRILDQRGDGLDWIWRLQVATKPDASVWLMRAQLAADGKSVRVTPYRPSDPAAARALFAGAAKPFRYEAGQWAALEPCAQSGQWVKDMFSAATNVDACSALLPGLGEDAALLPLRLTIGPEMLLAQTFSDLSRGPDALEQARRVRWFSGWAAINGAGPRATAASEDWHVQRDLRIGSEGGRVALRWRDGAASGYSLELERTSYPERKLAVLQLNVIEDASGQTLTYAWTDPQADSIGINLGWLQAGFVLESVREPASR